MAETEIKWMDLQAFVDEGYLQEVNRKFLHPLGLALAYDTGEDGKVTGLAGVWDDRDDPEGTCYMLPPEYADEVQRKAANVQLAGERTASTRLEALGYVVQPLDDVTRERPSNE